MWGIFCEHYPLMTSNKENCEIQKDTLDKGRIKEFKFLGYIVKVYKNKY